MGASFIEAVREPVIHSLEPPKTSHGTSAEAHGGEAAPAPSPYIRRIELLFYTTEHLFAVVFVAMLIRLGIERQAQEEAVSSVREAVHDQVADAFRDVDSRVVDFNRKVKEMSGDLSQIADAIGRINEVTGGSLYAAKLRPEDQREMSRTFLNPPFFRPKYTLKLTLTPKDADILTVAIDSEHLLENISGTVQELRLDSFLDSFTFQSGGREIDLRSTFHQFEFGEDTDTGRKQGKDRPLNIREKDLKRDSSSVRYHYDTGVKIQPAQTYFVRMLAEQQMRSSDVFVWVVTVATDEFCVAVSLAEPLTTNDLTLIARPMHHQPYDSFDPVLSDDGRTLTWKLKGVVLPYQGIQIWWSPKADPQRKLEAKA